MPKRLISKQKEQEQLRAEEQARQEAARVRDEHLKAFGAATTLAFRPYIEEMNTTRPFVTKAMTLLSKADMRAIIQGAHQGEMQEDAFLHGFVACHVKGLPEMLDNVAEMRTAAEANKLLQAINRDNVTELPELTERGLENLKTVVAGFTSVMREHSDSQNITSGLCPKVKKAKKKSIPTH